MAAAVMVVALSSSGCYYVRAAWEEARILAARQPISELARDQSIPASTRAKLELVRDARRFAGGALRLKTGGSFTHYSDIGRDTLVLVLSAARRDTLEAFIWRYPVVGPLPYRGYFDFAAARREAAKMAAEGYDTYLRPSDAFSTLGWFNDPLLNTTLRSDSVELVNTVLHELTHNTLFLKGQAEFNESFASLVGARGAEAFFNSRGLAAAAADANARWADQRLLASFWHRLAQEVDSAFATGRTRAERMEARARIYAEARKSLIELSVQFRRVDRRYAEHAQLDNAAVLARRVYGRDLELFEAVYRRENGDLAASINRIITLARGAPQEPLAAIRSWLEAGPDLPGPDSR